MRIKYKAPIPHQPKRNTVIWKKVTMTPTAAPESTRKEFENGFSNKLSICVACLQRAANSSDCLPLCRPWAKGNNSTTSTTRTTLKTTPTTVKLLERVTEPSNGAASIIDEPNTQSQLRKDSQLSNMLVQYENRLFWFMVFAMGSIMWLLLFIICILLCKNKNKKKRIDIIRSA